MKLLVKQFYVSLLNSIISSATLKAIAWGRHIRMIQKIGRNRRKPSKRRIIISHYANVLRHNDHTVVQTADTHLKYRFDYCVVWKSNGKHYHYEDLTVAVTNESGSSCTHLPRNCHMALKTVPTSLFVPRVRRYHMALFGTLFWSFSLLQGLRCKD